MTGVATLPDDIAIVVLDGKQHFLHTGITHGGAPLIGVDAFGIEYGGIFKSCSPFTTGESIGTEMNECNKLVFECPPLVEGGANLGCRLLNLLSALSWLNPGRVALHVASGMGGGGHSPHK